MKKKLIWAFMVFCALGFIIFVLLGFYGLVIFLGDIKFFDADKWIGTKIGLAVAGAMFILVATSYITKS